MTGSEPRKSPSLLYAVKRLELVIRSHLDVMLLGSGVTTPQYTALTVLDHRDGVSAAKLARDSFVTPQAMADMLRALADRGLIRRAANPESKRERLVYITDDGRRLLGKYADAADEIARRMVSDLAADEVAAFRDALDLSWIALRDRHE
ncbi:MarR family transcriptional regulator [Frankia sp. CNm7]|uniref:MarR family transcriptional regulator n=1 Tax=Frankia nepalensis TaxID=1836974 RepID=A0A937UKP4_9ACTN|nr:MarR family transcriptional regulator [Frankia nepalensis]MBL7500856.1 MarR family transcriptional regulator [Frankia nepalensis]MBL7509222.1 MarR family transcriptional regulator [Frankia nepalensis]MBL7517318.1 MarR family transcriptional regulator [Frankia nepalensis]MBL7627014.1 MarR family transcriptional regulator [Frankia nepalensis]